MEVFVARQPIFDRNEKVVAYELLFRDSLENKYTCEDADKATLAVINSSLACIGMSNITYGKRAFINFTENLLNTELASILPKENVVIEILETVNPTEEVVEACKKLKQKGYMIALDDFVFEEKFTPLIEIVDIIKVDFMLTKGKEREAIINRISNNKIRFLAEKVETREEYEEAKAVGYSLFQGYFFSKPVVISSHAMPTLLSSCVLILQEVSKKDLDFDKIEGILKKDLALTYKLLKLVNSAHYGIKYEVTSIKQALIMVGGNNIVKWLSVITVDSLKGHLSDELMVKSIVRARFGELLAPHIDMEHEAQNIFLLGMFSMIDSFINKPLEEILEDISISSEVKDAILGGESSLQQVYKFIIAYENGQWDQVKSYAEELEFDINIAPNIYLAATAWVTEIGYRG